MNGVPYSSRVRGLIGLFIIISMLTLLFWYQESQKPQISGSWHVAAYGDDQANGSLEQPLATLQQALAYADGVGGVIYLHGGTYSLTEAVFTKASGTSTSWIRVLPYPDEAVIIDCGGTGAAMPCVTLYGSYLEINGLTIVNAQKSAITIADVAHHIRIYNNTITAAEFGAIYTYSEHSEQIKSHLEFVGNRIFQNCLVNAPAPVGDGAGWPAAILVSYSDYVTITKNIIYENYGEGIVISSRHTLVEANELYDNYSVNLYLDNAGYTTVKRNFIHSTGNSAFLRYNDPAIGIGLANERGATYNALEHNTIVNNLVVDGRFGFSYSSYRDSGTQNVSGGTNYLLLANNTFFGGREVTIYIDTANVRHRDSLFANNLFYQPNSARPLTNLDNPKGLVFEHNVWYGGQLTMTPTHDFVFDPLLTNPGGTTPEDYIPLPSSPLIDAGLDVSTVNDFLGQVRPVQVSPIASRWFDIGAFEVQRP